MSAERQLNVVKESTLVKRNKTQAKNMKSKLKAKSINVR